MFLWRGQSLVSVGDIINAVTAIQSREEAQEFMRDYGAHTAYAKENIGYMAGYMSHDQAQRIYDWFECAHPIFGTKVPTFEEALEAGMKLGEYSKKYGSKKALEMLGYVKQPDTQWALGIKDILSDFSAKG